MVPAAARAPRLLLGAVIALIGLAARGAAAEADAGAALAAPLVALSNEPYLACAEHAAPASTARTSLQVFHDPRATLSRVISSSVQPDSDGFFADWLDRDALARAAPEVVLVVLGSQLRTSDMRSSAMAASLAPLQSMLDAAASSITAPYVMHELGAAATPGERAQQLASSLGGDTTTTVVACGPGSQHQELASALEQLPGGQQPAVVVLCTAAGAAATGTPAGVAAELQQLQAAHDAVAALRKRQLTLYAVSPHDALLQAHRRRLQASSGVGADVGTCDALCQTQVKWLEGILAAAILVIAAFSGMCCLYMLDTPTRFEKPKEGMARE